MQALEVDCLELNSQLLHLPVMWILDQFLNLPVPQFPCSEVGIILDLPH